MSTSVPYKGVSIKRLALISIVLFAFFAGTASADRITFWQEKGKTYKCAGIDTYVKCTELNHKPAYSVVIVSGVVAVMYKGKLVFSCYRGKEPSVAADTCTVYQP